MSLNSHIYFIVLASILFPVTVFASSTRRPASNRKSPKPPAFWLAGDSTTAAQNPSGGGWGNGFFETLTGGAIGTNLAHDGDTTVTFISHGGFDNIIDAVNRTKSIYDPYVTIQFGHNDQKASNNVTVEEFTDNLINMALEVQAAGGTPILVTPISRRSFNSSGLVIEDLAQYRNLTISAANSIDVDYIDLNEASTIYLDAIGSTDAATYNRITGDFTHLNPSGSIVFGAMVSWLLTNTTSIGGALTPYTKPSQAVLDAIESGSYIYPSA